MKYVCYAFSFSLTIFLTQSGYANLVQNTFEVDMSGLGVTPIDFAEDYATDSRDIIYDTICRDVNCKRGEVERIELMPRSKCVISYDLSFRSRLSSERLSSWTEEVSEKTNNQWVLSQTTPNKIRLKKLGDYNTCASEIERRGLKIYNVNGLNIRLMDLNFEYRVASFSSFKEVCTFFEDCEGVEVYSFYFNVHTRTIEGLLLATTQSRSDLQLRISEYNQNATKSRLALSAKGQSFLEVLSLNRDQ